MIEKLLLKNRILKKIMHIANKFRKNKNKNEENFFFSPAPLAPCLSKKHEMYDRIPRLLVDLVSSRTETTGKET